VVELSEFDAVLHFFKRLFDAPLAKGILAAILAIARVCLGATMRPAYTAILVLWLADWATGTIRAWVDPDDTIKSRRWYHALIKLWLYLILMLVGYQVSRIEIIFVGAALQSVIEGAVIGTEALSVCENLDLLGKLAGIDIPIIAQLVQFLRGKQKKALAEMERE
jgi:phage-related holin